MGITQTLTTINHRSIVAESRLDLTRDGRDRYKLKTPYRHGTTHVIFEPQDYIARLLPKPQVNLVCFHRDSRAN